MILASFLVGLPLLHTVVLACSKKAATLRQLLHSLLFFAGINLVEFATGYCYQQVFMPIFFRDTTPLWQKFVFRGGAQATIFSILIEFYWHASLYLRKHFGVKESNCHILFASVAIVLPCYSRIMQGSAASLEEIVYLESIGTLAEVYTADVLLRGMTPVAETVRVGALVKKFSGRKSVRNSSGSGSKIAVDDSSEIFFVDDYTAEEAAEENLAEAAAARRTKDRHNFCVSALFMITLAECASLFCSSLFWLVNTASPGPPGSAAVAKSRTVINFLVMLFGELFVTDGLLAVFSHYSTRYRVDVGYEWEALKKNKRSFALV